MLGDRQGEFEGIDRVESEIAFAEQRGFRIDGIRLDAFDIEAADHELGELQFGGRLLGGCRYVGHEMACLFSLSMDRGAAVYHPRPPTLRRLPEPATLPIVRLIEPTTTPTTRPLPALRASYVEGDAQSLLAEPDVLAVIDFGVAGPQCTDPRFLRIGLEPLGRPQLEVWRGHGPVSRGRHDALAWSADGDYLYFAIEVDEAAHGGLNVAAEQAYAEICRFLADFRFGDGSGGHILRLWNYMDAINLGEGDDERYRHFCCGRARGITPAARNGYSAATAIGRRDGVRVLQVYGLAARLPGVAVENPRQVSAWAYPREYGPVAPTFARATRTPAGQLLVSGTAAVVGHRSQHVGDTPAQLEETLLNLDALLAAAGPQISARGIDATLLKIYLRQADDAAAVLACIDRRHPDAPGRMVLLGDICRHDLSIEIDGIQV